MYELKNSLGQKLYTAAESEFALHRLCIYTAFTFFYCILFFYSYTRHGTKNQSQMVKDYSRHLLCGCQKCCNCNCRATVSAILQPCCPFFVLISTGCSGALLSSLVFEMEIKYVISSALQTQCQRGFSRTFLMPLRRSSQPCVTHPSVKANFRLLINLPLFVLG